MRDSSGAFVWNKSHGNPVTGVTVAWRIVSGFGSLSADHSSTNAMGEASVNFTADGRVGTTLVSASIGESSVQFTIVVDVGEATQMSIAAGNGQSAVVGGALPDELSVLVVDAHANPVPGVAVTFAVTANTGSLSAGGSNNTTVTATTVPSSFTSWVMPIFLPISPVIILRALFRRP